METESVFQPNKPDVIHEVIDGEAVLVNLKNGKYYSTDKVGASVWTLIEQGLSVGQIIDDIQMRYNGNKDTITQSILQLITQLQTETLIVTRVSGENSTEQLSGNADAPKAELEGTKIPFEEPKLEKYSDMEDLLLLDPIHDVEEEGWPKANVSQNEN